MVVKENPDRKKINNNIIDNRMTSDGSGVFFVNFKHIPQIFLIVAFLALNK